MRDNGHASTDQEILPHRSTGCLARQGRSPETYTSLQELKDPKLCKIWTLHLRPAAAFSSLLSSSLAVSPRFASAGLPAPLVGNLIAIIVELGGGLLLLVGFQMRIVALVLAGFALAAALAFQNKFSDANEMIHFLKDIAIIGGLLQVAAFGPGSVSLDARRLNLAR
jgi:putative oxidoreductase